MRLVKLVGDLPNVTYLLANNRRPVTEALESPRIKSSEYVEKIVQIEHRMPEVAPERLSRLLTEVIDSAIKDLPEERLDQERYSEIHRRIVEPLVQTPRHLAQLSKLCRSTLK